jgi:L-asparaginase
MPKADVVGPIPNDGGRPGRAIRSLHSGAAGGLFEGITPYGRSAPNARHRLLLRAVHSGLPVVRVGRGNTEGFVPLDNPLFIGGSNLTATKARLLLMACLMRFGALPPEANPDDPTSAESAAVREKVAEYQAVFNTH